MSVKKIRELAYKFEKFEKAAQQSDPIIDKLNMLKNDFYHTLRSASAGSSFLDEKEVDALLKEANEKTFTPEARKLISYRVDSTIEILQTIVNVLKDQSKKFSR